MAGIVLALPIVPGKEEAWLRFCQELAGSRRTRYEDSRMQLGITYERFELLNTAFGATAVTTLEAHDIGEALAQMILSDRPFDRWYREQLQDLHGVSLESYNDFASRPVYRPHDEVVLEWAGEFSE